MRQQKNDDSQDEFQIIKQQVQTLNAYKSPSPPKNTIKNHPRMHYLTQKHKLGLITNVNPLESNTYIHTKKETQVSIGKIIKIGSVTFRSNFQSGSIGNVNFIGNNSFKITLDNQTNSQRCNTWFDFIVQGIKGEASFKICGFKKKASLYNQGMKICYRQISENGKWKRGGSQLSYVKASSEEQSARSFQVRFNFTFKQIQHNGVQFSYCFPYGVTKLHQLTTFLHTKSKIQTLASTFQGKDLPLINIGNLSSKEVIVLSSRVHPGETVSSFIMEGFLRELTSQSQYSKYLRDRFLFKIMPMINIDGVRHGNFRFSASGVDLNRRWKDPSQEHHPQIYYLKQMILRENKQKNVKMFIDMHGHSRKKNVFFYGCCEESQQILDNFKPKSFPFLMSKIHEAYNYHDCNFTVQPDKEGTARIALWKELKISEIYTLQASFCSSNKGNNYHQTDYQKMGQKLCEGISFYFYQSNNNSSSKLQNIIPFRQNIFNELRSNPHLLRHGNQQNTGSESQPQKGERKDMQKLKNYISHARNASQLSNKSERHEKSTRKKDNQPLNLYSDYSHKMQQTRNKQKSEADFPKDQQKLKSQEMKDFFPQIRNNTIKTDYNYQQKNYEVNKSIRVHNPTKGSTVPITKVALYNQTDPINQEDSLKKKQKRVVTPFQNTQYRRIKHMMQNNSNTKKTNQRPQLLNQSLNTRKIDVEMKNNGVVPRFYANTPYKKRKSSLQIFYNKSTNKSTNKNQKQMANVFCRGKQIFL